MFIFKTLKSKFTAAVGVVFLLTVSVFATTVLISVNRQIQLQVEDNAKVALDGFANLLDLYRMEALDRTKHFAERNDLIVAMWNGDPESLRRVTVPMLKESDMDYLIVTNEKGRVLFRAHRPDEVPGPDDNIADQANIKLALAGNPSSGIEEGGKVKLSIRAGAPIRSDGAIAGVLSAGYVLSNKKLVDGAKNIIGGEFSVFMGNERISGTVRNDLGELLVPTVPKELLPSEHEDFHISLDPALGEGYVTAYRTLTAPDGKSIGTLSASRSLSLATRIVQSIVMTMATTFLVLVLPIVWIIIVLARGIAGPLSGLKRLIGSAGSGNLTVHGEIFSIDELSELTATFNRMVQQQAGMASEVRSSASDLKTAANGIAVSVGNAVSSTCKVSACVAEVSELMTQGGSAIRNAHSVVLELAELANSASNRSRDVLELSTKAVTEAERGNTTVDNAVRRMDKIKNLSQETEEWINRLDEDSRKISGITETITGLARQTNLLALNAAIEAAKAGESGKGFAVVADEVRKLAEESSKGAAEVSQLVKRIVDNTGGAVERIRQSGVEVEKGALDVKLAGEALNSILDAGSKAGEAVRGITEMAEREARHSEEIVGLVESMLDTLGQTEKRAMEAAVMTDKTHTAIQKIETDTEALNSMSNKLESSVRAFILPDTSKTEKMMSDAVKVAKSDHLLWKMRIDAMLSGTERVVPEDVKGSNECRLGKWYTASDNPLRNMPEYAALEGPHETVHEMTKLAAHYYVAGDFKQAKKCAAMLSKASAKVIRLLNALARSPIRKKR